MTLNSFSSPKKFCSKHSLQCVCVCVCVCVGLPWSLRSKESTCNAGDPGWKFRMGEIPPEEGMTTHSSILAWRIPWTEEPGGLQFMGSQRVGHNWSDLARTVCVCYGYVLSHVLSCGPMNPYGSFVLGISQLRILEWVAISTFRGCSLLRDPTCISFFGR